MGINQFSDLTWEEFKNSYLPTEKQNCSAQTNFKYINKKANEDLPLSYDWRDFNKVSPVKNQKHCGSCWTFSTVGAMEAHYRIQYNKEYFFAEQQLVDCADDYGNFGCNGGLPSQAYEYIKDNKLSLSENYEYVAKTGDCKYDKATMGVGEVQHGSFNITSGDEEMVKRSLAKVGPVSVAFEVIPEFRHYRQGVYRSDTCKNSPSDVNHAVLAVGYGEIDDDLKYFTIKNSWGEEWGNEGFFQIQRNVNMCGIAVCNSFPNMNQKDIIPIDLSTLEI